jgi:hypothetical protein
MPHATTFAWPGPDCETVYIPHVVQYPSGDVVLVPEHGPSITLRPASLSTYSLDRLIAGVTTLVDYHRSNADRLDEIAQRLALVQQAFAGVGVTLPLQEEDVCLHFGYDHPLALYFLDFEDADECHEFGYGGIFFVPGTRLARGQTLDVLYVLVDQASSDELAMFRDAIVMDLPV